MHRRRRRLDESNRLQLNTGETEFLWCRSTSARRQHQLPTDQLVVGSDLLSPVIFVRDLGIYVDADLSMRTHVLRTAGRCFAVFRQIRSIRRSVTWPMLESLVVLLVLSRLDYGCATLARLPSQLLDRLQSVHNAAARLIFGASRQVHVTPLLRSLHWLQVPERIAFRLSVLVYRCLHGTYGTRLSVRRPICSASLRSARGNDFALRRPRHLLAVAVRSVLQSVTVPLLLPHQLFGTTTACRRRCGHPHRCSCSGVGSSLSFSGVP